MNYSNHALRRMNARNITVAMVETSFDECLKFGNWDQKGDRLTIDATSDDFHEHIQSTQKNLLNLILTDLIVIWVNFVLRPFQIWRIT